MKLNAYSDTLQHYNEPAKDNNTENILKVTRNRRQNIYKGTTIRLTENFSLEWMSGDDE